MVKVGAELGGRAALLGLLVVAARTLPETEFGRYAYALAAGLIAAQLASGGLQVSLLRRLSVDRTEMGARQAFGDALRARTMAGAVLAIAAALLASTVAASALEAAALAVIAISPTVAAHGELWLQAPRAVGRLELEAVAALAGRLAIALAGAVALVAGAGLPGLAAAYLLGSTLTLVVSRAIALRFLQPSRSTGLAQLRSWYRESLPLAIAGVASLLMFRIDVLLLELLRDVETVGLYTVAYRPFEATLVVSVALMAATFPQLARRAANGLGLASLAARVGALLVGVAFAIAAAGWWLGPTLIALAFGPAYDAAGDVLKILLVALPAMFLNALVTHTLIALGRRWSVASAMAAGFGVNIAVNLWLIPGLGATGAALATVAAETTLFVVAALGLAWPAARAGMGRTRGTGTG